MSLRPCLGPFFFLGLLHKRGHLVFQSLNFLLFGAQFAATAQHILPFGVRDARFGQKLEWIALRTLDSGEFGLRFGLLSRNLSRYGRILGLQRGLLGDPGVILTQNLLNLIVREPLNRIVGVIRDRVYLGGLGLGAQHLGDPCWADFGYATLASEGRDGCCALLVESRLAETARLLISSRIFFTADLGLLFRRPLQGLGRCLLWG
jgi:hypothetical protein